MLKPYYLHADFVRIRQSGIQSGKTTSHFPDSKIEEKFSEEEIYSTSCAEIEAGGQRGNGGRRGKGDEARWWNRGLVREEGGGKKTRIQVFGNN